jgi:hypothetical protein
MRRSRPWRAALARAAAGDGQVVGVVAEAGVGQHPGQNRLFAAEMHWARAHIHVGTYRDGHPSLAEECHREVENVSLVVACGDPRVGYVDDQLRRERDLTGDGAVVPEKRGNSTSGDPVEGRGCRVIDPWEGTMPGTPNAETILTAQQTHDLTSGCASRARPDLWEPWAGTCPGPPGSSDARARRVRRPSAVRRAASHLKRIVKIGSSS